MWPGPGLGEFPNAQPRVAGREGTPFLLPVTKGQDLGLSPAVRSVENKTASSSWKQEGEQPPRPAGRVVLRAAVLPVSVPLHPALAERGGQTKQLVTPCSDSLGMRLLARGGGCCLRFPA